ANDIRNRPSVQLFPLWPCACARCRAVHAEKVETVSKRSPHPSRRSRDSFRECIGAPLRLPPRSSPCLLRPLELSPRPATSRNQLLAILPSARLRALPDHPHSGAQ